MSKRKALPLPSLIKKLDRVFSKYVRMNHADTTGTVQCVTCGNLMHWKEAHAGHFVSRRHMSVRWNELNVHPQDAACNTFRDGALDEYSRYIIDTYGLDIFENLLRMKHQTKKWSRSELEELINEYSAKVKQLETSLPV